MDEIPTAFERRRIRPGRFAPLLDNVVKNRESGARVPKGGSRSSGVAGRPDEVAAEMGAVLEELTAIFGAWRPRGSDGAGAGSAAAGGRAPEGARGGGSEPGARGGSGKPAPCEAAALVGDGAFNDLAMRIHEVQRATNPVLRGFWNASPGGEPASWREIPPVPAAAFRDVAIVSGTPERVFRTSGTTGGAGRRGEHHVPSLRLYRAAARANYRRHLMRGAESFRVLSLIPGPRESPDSSLSAMVGFIAAEPEVSGVSWGFHPRDGVNVSAVRKAASAADPVLVLTTAFALVRLLDVLEGEPVPLPGGSRVMETGGFKGRAAEVDRAALYGRAERALDTPRSRIVNEYGMTELLSQAYDGVAGEAAALPGRLHRFPPWVRTRALDPATLAPLPPGRPGLLAHFDLANAGSVCHILTEDFGHTTADGGLRLLGRVPGSPPRGCSLAAELFLRAIRIAP